MNLRLGLLLLIAANRGPSLPERTGTGSIVLATTTSTQDTGLLDELVPLFTRETGIAVKVIAVGSGAALEMGEKGDADALLVHAPAAEELLVTAGHLVGGALVMHNDFVIVGPNTDHAALSKTRDVADAMKRIRARGRFISRGDDSGTHKKELELWALAGVELRDATFRQETGQGMAATLTIANEKGAYCLADRGTWLVQKKNLERLSIVFSGDPSLRNLYHAYAVSAAKHPAAREAAGRRFVEFLMRPDTQRLIGEFRRKELGEALFVPSTALAAPAP